MPKTTARKSIVIARPDHSTKLVVIGEQNKAIFWEETPVETLLKAYAHVYRVICKEIYSDEKFICEYCGIVQSMAEFSGIVVTPEKPKSCCMSCAGRGDIAES
jgi:hypothetical protein